MAPQAPRSEPDRGSSHTTWSRSMRWPASQAGGIDHSAKDRRPNTRQSTATQFFRSKYLQHRGRPDPRGRLGRRRLRTSLLEGVSHQAAETNPHNSGRSRNRSNGEAFATRSTRRHQLRERGATHGHQFLQRAGQNRPPRWLFRLKRATCFSRLRPAGTGGYMRSVYGGVG